MAALSRSPCSTCSRREEDTVCLDAIGGASAGALVALFSAWALLHGYDAPTLLHRA